MSAPVESEFSPYQQFYLEADYTPDDYVSFNPLAYKFEVEMAAGVFTDVSSYLVRASFERSIGTMLDNIRADNAMFELDDVAGAFAPRRGAGIKPGRQVKLTASHVSSVYALFSGRATHVRNQPLVGDHQKSIIEAVSDMDRVARRTITTSLYQNINAGSLFTEIMTRCAVASFAADAFGGTIGFAWYHERDAVNALEELVRSGDYYLYVDGSGTVNLKNPAWGFESINPYVEADYVDANYVRQVEEFSEFFDLQYGLTADRVYNDVKINSRPRRIATDIATVAVLNAPALIPSSGALGFWLTYQDPVLGGAPTPVASFQTQVASTDYYAAVASDGSGANKTSTLSVQLTRFGETAVATVVNGTSGDVWLTRFNLHGYPVRDLGALGFQTEDSSSQAVYGRRSFTMDDCLIQDLSYISSLATDILSTRKEPQSDLVMTLVNEFPTVLLYNIGDSVSVVNSVTGVNSPWAIFGMNHTLDIADGVRHQVDYDLRFY